MKKLALLPDFRGWRGGPASFQRLVAKELSHRGVDISYNVDSGRQDCVLLINATRRIISLLRAKQGGSRIVQRLGSPFPSDIPGVNPIRERLRTWLGDRNMILIRQYATDRLVYQSGFVRECWETEHGMMNKPNFIIYNGTDLSEFSTVGPVYKSASSIRIISVEGTQMIPEESAAFQCVRELRRRGIGAELLVFGKPWGDAAFRYEQYAFVKFMGQVSNQELPYYYRGSSLYILNDIAGAGCPNSVIEALACGCPVVGYSPGVLPEMLTEGAGKCVPCVGNPWKGERPGNVEALADAVLEVAENNNHFRKGARQLAEERYSLDHMVDQYMKVLFE